MAAVALDTAYNKRIAIKELKGRTDEDDRGARAR